MKTHKEWSEAQFAAIEDGVTNQILPRFHDLVANLLHQHGAGFTLQDRVGWGGAVILHLCAAALIAWVREAEGPFLSEREVERGFRRQAAALVNYLSEMLGVRPCPLPMPDRTTTLKHYNTAAVANVDYLLDGVRQGCAALSGPEEERGAMTLYSGLGVVLAQRYIHDAEGARRWVGEVTRAIKRAAPQGAILPVSHR